MAAPLAYHLIWTTYGTRLPGDARGWIKSGVLGIQPPDPALEQHAREMLVESEVHLTPEQRAYRDDLERAVFLLRDKKSKLPEDGYYRELEKLLLKLANFYNSTSGTATN